MASNMKFSLFIINNDKPFIDNLTKKKNISKRFISTSPKWQRGKVQPAFT